VNERFVRIGRLRRERRILRGGPDQDVETAFQSEGQCQHLQIRNDPPLRLDAVDVVDTGILSPARDVGKPRAQVVLSEIELLAARLDMRTGKVLALIGGAQSGRAVGHGIEMLRRATLAPR
jgi:hypothetical protein